MQTQLSPEFRTTPAGQEAESILRSCVHCGFCLATCPTYQLLGNELDSPRGRIYLIKQVLEGQPATVRTQQHLDRCLTCRNCETTCPSGVRYGQLLDIGRDIVERQVGRSPWAWMQRAALSALLPYPRRFTPLLRLGQAVRSGLPHSSVLSRKIPAYVPKPPSVAPPTAPQTRMLLLRGCVQDALAPNINAAATRVLAALGIECLPAEGCCGAVSFHLNFQAAGRATMQANVTRWQAALQAGAVGIVSTASGCGVTVKDYGHLLGTEAAHAVAAQTQDLAQVISARQQQLWPLLRPLAQPVRVAWHPPCTLQHGQKVRGVVEALLTQAGYTLVPVADAHLCCGSAGTYALLQPQLAGALQRRKLDALQAHDPAVIVTANIGCLTHLQSGTTRPVRHWIELLAERLALTSD